MEPGPPREDGGRSQGDVARPSWSRAPVGGWWSLRLGASPWFWVRGWSARRKQWPSASCSLRPRSARSGHTACERLRHTVQQRPLAEVPPVSHWAGSVRGWKTSRGSASAQSSTKLFLALGSLAPDTLSSSVRTTEVPLKTTMSSGKLEGLLLLHSLDRMNLGVGTPRSHS